MHHLLSLVADQPDTVEQCVRQMGEYLRRFGGFIAHAAVEHPNEFTIAVATVFVAIFTAVLAIATIRLWNSTAALAKFAEEQAGDMKASIAVARDSAQAAREQVALSRGALITTERAFVYCERINAHWTAHKETEEIIEWTFVPVWKNSGKTPTRRARSQINSWVGIEAGDLPADFNFPNYEDDNRWHTMIGPGATMHAVHIHLPIETLKKIRAGIAHVYIWGWFDYDDVFDQTPRHRAEFCLEIEVTGNPIYKEGGFAYRVQGPFNGFDEDCYRRPQPYNRA
jgi:hypothetical protein